MPTIAFGDPIDFGATIDAVLNQLASPVIFVPLTLLLIAVIAWLSRDRR